MAKQVKQVKQPKGKFIPNEKNPISYYGIKPTWKFSSVDEQCWAFSQDNIGESFWTEILPKLKDLESQLWNEISIVGKKKHHTIKVADLNKIARDRLDALMLEIEEVYVIHLSNTHCLYGYHMDGAFYILWYDKYNGDNNTCVCRSILKHT